MSKVKKIFLLIVLCPILTYFCFNFVAANVAGAKGPSSNGICQSVDESKKSNVFVKCVSDSVVFKGRLVEETFEEAWIEDNREIFLIIYLAPFLPSHTIWRDVNTQSLVVRGLSIPQFSPDFGRRLIVRYDDKSFSLEDYYHSGFISSFSLPFVVESEEIEVEFFGSKDYK